MAYSNKTIWLLQNRGVVGVKGFISAIYLLPLQGLHFSLYFFAVDFDVAVLLCLMPALFFVTLAGWSEVLLLDCKTV